jgi:hypothetical protein
MQDGPEALQEVVATSNPEELPPRPPIEMAIGADSALSHPALGRASQIRTAMMGGIALTAASSRHDQAWGRG